MLSILTIDGQILRKAIICGANEIYKNRAYIDSLNVFPVPDGDTGINMSMTAIAAAKEVEKLNTTDIYEVAKAASSGSLRGARGNSGVILSQLFRGFAKGLEGKTNVDAEDLSIAFVKAMEAAYKAVMKPKEGTILTIAKSLAESSIEAVFDEDDITEVVKLMLSKAHKTLEKTQFMLPELKEAGVVDAGGRGLLYIIEGALASANTNDDIKVVSLGESKKDTSEQPKEMLSNIKSNKEIEFGYCTELFINIGDDKIVKSFEDIEEDLKSYLESKGDSIVLVGDDDLVKIHVHTNNPGEVLEKALTMGDISNIKIENMREQHTAIVSFLEDNNNEPVKEPIPPKKVGFISVSSGKGLMDLFKSLGVDYIVEGGQTMNPSTEVFISAIEKVNANNIFILPNNKNIILAAEQAAKLIKDKKVYVLPTKSVPQGISSLVSYVDNIEIEDNIKQMSLAMDNIKTGQITYAVRDTNLDGKKIKSGDILCMLDGKISNVNKDIIKGTKELIDIMLKEDSSKLVSIYYGEGQTEEDATAIGKYIEDKYSDCEVEIFSGGQPLYYYIISME